jgi:hypothetical protein
MPFENYNDVLRFKNTLKSEGYTISIKEASAEYSDLPTDQYTCQSYKLLLHWLDDVVAEVQQQYRRDPSGTVTVTSAFQHRPLLVIVPLLDPNNRQAKNVSGSSHQPVACHA